ncbi:cytidylate kinase family protein [Desulfitibacter alkalitolerans]|uniref:cytidylate kinase family protein n=1 Tax=Desulfitibacter alkalitolerans TaxID=264641 RepID=UPI0004804A83|nr:cytidylate kinase family protein [Desulfitibacter alkalitolerans]
MSVITISRQFGAGGGTVGKDAAKKLGFLLVTQNVINEGLSKLGLSPQAFSFEKNVRKDPVQEKKRIFYRTALHDLIMELAAKESIILLGRGGQFLFRDHPDAFHVRIQAPINQRVQWVQEIYQLDEKKALRMIQEKDRLKKRFTQEVFKHSWMDMEMFDLVINTGKISPQRAAKLVVQGFKLRKKELLSMESEEKIQKNLQENKEKVNFMHPSEKEFARVLDFYKIPWEYEPRTFPLQRDSDGKITEAFSPDFYLPASNLFVELTTQRQKLVGKKNKKIRRLKELYPDVNFKIIYGRDYHNLLKKLGLDKG